ncbi:MAG: hypothetical protein G01um101448_1116 [Parcubacteria group bacterium Gr01-1014_48]|nr:MAG: hypothetical protein Greene041614_413 [Parcubacteria group bacterium Greene0416_14]TSC71662.1 MAG: hypothetical protein G01um101448_1116 [Parcubacteria group bacterium Gr01-1014_48]TSD00933.1 MAG: hypothetical protein Greene101415_583 [Parcubacteria group bacterium Greene1014_15]TSD07885.1 MAG: hypothetical protein Greene07144_611 [Parcubacteria group bacterium Greene0714_4]
MNQKSHRVLQYAEKLFHRYERRFSSLFFVFGFLWDNLTLTRVDMWLDISIIFSYLVIATFGIAVLNLSLVKKEESILKRISLWSPFLMQFAFGGLFSSFIVFYTRSATLAANWPFLLFLVCMFVGNEFFRKHYQRFGFQMSILFTALFSFSIFYVPIIVNRIGAEIFLLSGVVSLAAIGVVLSFFGKIMPYRVRASRRMLTRSIPAIYLAITIMYFTNLIPPLPLSLKDMGVYHRVERMSNGGYSVVYEDKKWYEFFKRFEVFHQVRGERVYVYSSVFAPTDLDTRILHRWQYLDNAGVWQTADKLQFPIYGGRDGGYRGYSVKTNTSVGKWRVDVITERGQLLGRVKFEVVSTGSAKLVTKMF